MNTIWADRSGVHDALSTVAALRDWLSGLGLGEDAGPGDLEQFCVLRDALRTLAALATGVVALETGDAPPRASDIARAVAKVNHAAGRAPAWPRLAYRDDALELAEPRGESAVQRALSSLAQQAIELLAGPDRARLRACNAPTCVQYFIQDHPRREWCSPACGNRVRAARHYQRARLAGSEHDA
jgi:predicted RNA-binding Zn ribbon-like protein